MSERPSEATRPKKAQSQVPTEPVQPASDAPTIRIPIKVELRPEGARPHFATTVKGTTPPPTEGKPFVPERTTMGRYRIEEEVARVSGGHSLAR